MPQADPSPRGPSIPASPLGKAQPGTSGGYGRCLQPGGPGLGHRAQRCSVRQICLSCSPGAQTEGFPSVFCKKTSLGSRGGAFTRDPMVLRRCGPLARLRRARTVPALLSRLVPAWVS